MKVRGKARKEFNQLKPQLSTTHYSRKMKEERKIKKDIERNKSQNKERPVYSTG